MPEQQSTQQQQPKLRINPQQFAQEVAQEIAADLGKQRSAQAPAPQEQYENPASQSGSPF